MSGTNDLPKVKYDTQDKRKMTLSDLKRLMRESYQHGVIDGYKDCAYGRNDNIQRMANRFIKGIGQGSLDLAGTFFVLPT